MIKITKKILLLFLLGILVLPGLTLAQEGIGGMLNQAATNAGFNTQGNPETNFATIMGTITRAFISILGVIFISYLLFGGYLWMTAAGNDEKLVKAKSIIRNGIIGLIVVLSAAAIYFFVREIFVGGLSTGGSGAATLRG